VACDTVVFQVSTVGAGRESNGLSVLCDVPSSWDGRAKCRTASNTKLLPICLMGEGLEKTVATHTHAYLFSFLSASSQLTGSQ